MAEEDAAANESVTLLPSQLLNLINLFLQNFAATKFLNELVVINTSVLYGLYLNARD